MPVHLIGTADGSGAAGISVSQVLAMAAFRARMPVTVIEVGSAASRREAQAPLFPARLVSGSEAATLVRKAGSDALVILTGEARFLPSLLPVADVVAIPGTRIGSDLEHAYAIYRAIDGLQLETPSGSALKPWLLAAGWSCSRAPEIRLQGWRKRLSQVAGEAEGNLRCLPLVIPWYQVGSLTLANQDRIDFVGKGLLQHLASIAAGRQPERPAAGLAGGDPWPDITRPMGSPPSPVPVRRPYLSLAPGA